MQDALRPYFASQTVRDKFAGASSAMGTVLLKGVTGAMGKAAGKYLGDTFAEDAGNAISKAVQEAAEQGAEDTASALQGITDSLAEKVLSAYRKRRASVEHFKSQLGEAIKAIGNSKRPPVFIIIDELDRCRPTYAIKVLEETKHLFDITGVVFIVGLHGEQLEHSVRAVYGHGFVSKDYPSRFFSRRYTLRDLDLGELVTFLFNKLEVPAEKLNYPRFYHNSRLDFHTPDIAVSKILESWSINPRQTYQVLSALRVWCSIWDEPFKMELVLALCHIVMWLKGDRPVNVRDIVEYKVKIVFPFHSPQGEKRKAPSQLIQLYFAYINNSLNSAIGQTPHDQSIQYVFDVMRAERKARFGEAEMAPEDAHSKMRDYGQIVETVGRFHGAEDE